MTRAFSRTRHSARLAALAATVALTAAVFVLPAKAETDPKAVISTYADIALANYEDALTTAKALDQAVDALIAKPSAETLAAAKEAWRAARIPYQQTEAFRFGNVIVDDWEGRVNAWPLDEGLIDYVDKSYGTESDENTLYTANVIANPSIKINGETIDASKLTPELLSGTLQEAGEIEANVATGYHAIEFLLWGQDLNGTKAGCRRASLHRFRRGELHRRQLRPPRRLSRRRQRSARHRPGGDGRQLESRRPGPQGADRRRCHARHRDHPDRHGLAFLRRTRRASA